jgi:hypothetical protein
MTDLTIIYYTDGSLPEGFAKAVRDHLAASARAAGGIPIVAVSQAPLHFGQGICVGRIGRSYRSILWQILKGAEETHTTFVSLCEHDVLYPPEHFVLRPPAGGVVFDQNRHRALIDCGFYSINRGGRSMQLVIADREVLVENLRAKLRLCGTDDALHNCFEPGKGEDRLGIAAVPYEMRPAEGPGILDIVNHGGNFAPRKRHSGTLQDKLTPWGTIDQLCGRYSIPGRMA